MNSSISIYNNLYRQLSETTKLLIGSERNEVIRTQNNGLTLQKIIGWWGNPKPLGGVKCRLMTVKLYLRACGFRLSLYFYNLTIMRILNENKLTKTFSQT